MTSTEATTPDPLDVLKYMFILAWEATESDENLDYLRDQLEALIAPFTAVTAVDLDNLRYSDGRPITITSEYAPGRSFVHHYLPPGYPTGVRA